MQPLTYYNEKINMGISLTLCLLWMYAASAKILEYEQFETQISQVSKTFRWYFSLDYTVFRIQSGSLAASIQNTLVRINRFYNID